jgi:putative tricarboxylic transport membrane protein
VFEVIESLSNLHYVIGIDQFAFLVIGIAAGIVVGALPGVGPLLGVVMAIPFTFYMKPVSAMALLMGIYQGGSYGGALSATVIGIPGTPMAAATLLDAHPMALGGRASEAVTLATIGSATGGVLSGLMLIAIAPELAAIALKFGPSETSAICVARPYHFGRTVWQLTLEGLDDGFSWPFYCHHRP